MGKPILTRDHKLEDIEMVDAKLLVKFHGAATKVFLENPEQMEPEGEILAVGPGYRLPDGTRSPLCVNVGDIVLFGAAKCTAIKVDGDVCHICSENSIEAILSRKKA